MTSVRNKIIELLEQDVRHKASGPYIARSSIVTNLKGLFARTRDAIERESTITLSVKTFSVRGRVFDDALDLSSEIGSRKVILLPHYVRQAKDRTFISGYRMGRFSEDENRFASRLTNPCEVTIWSDGFVRFSDEES